MFFFKGYEKKNVTNVEIKVRRKKLPPKREDQQVRTKQTSVVQGKFKRKLKKINTIHSLNGCLA